MINKPATLMFIVILYCSIILYGDVFPETPSRITPNYYFKLFDSYNDFAENNNFSQESIIKILKHFGSSREKMDQRAFLFNLLEINVFFTFNIHIDEKNIIAWSGIKLDQTVDSIAEFHINLIKESACADDDFKISVQNPFLKLMNEIRMTKGVDDNENKIRSFINSEYFL